MCRRSVNCCWSCSLGCFSAQTREAQKSRLKKKKAKMHGSYAILQSAVTSHRCRLVPVFYLCYLIRQKFVFHIQLGKRRRLRDVQSAQIAPFYVPLMRLINSNSWKSFMLDGRLKGGGWNKVMAAAENESKTVTGLAPAGWPERRVSRRLFGQSHKILFAMLTRHQRESNNTSWTNVAGVQPLLILIRYFMLQYIIKKMLEDFCI